MLVFSACGSAPPPPSDDAAYAAAERALSQGNLDEARSLFAELAAHTRDPEQQALYRYRLAMVARKQGHTEEAQRILAEVATGETAERAQLAEYQAAVAVFEAGGGDGALRALAEDHPETVAADKAVKFIATHVKTPEQAAETATWLESLAPQHPESTVADNALWWAAELRLFHLHDLPGTRALLRRLALAFPESPLTDDAIWRLAQLHLRQGQWIDAAEAFEALIKIRNETSYFVGSYLSPYLDDAALMIARIRYHGLQDPAGAALAYEALLADFPTSVLRDDALFELAQVWFAAERPREGHAALRRLLAAHPESRHVPAARALAADPHADPPDVSKLAAEPFHRVGP